MPEDPFSSPKLRLAQAKQDLCQFKTDRDAFLDEHNWERVIDTDPDTGTQLHKYRCRGPLPELLISRVYVTIEGLRSTLDQTTSSIGRILGRSGYCHFPFGKSSEEFERNISKKGGINDLPPDILSAIRRFKPYKTPDGNELLWAVGRTSNI